MGRVSPGPQLAHSGDSSEDEDTDGGVSLNPSSADVKGKGPSREADMISLPCDDWPDLAAPATPWKKKSGSTSTDSPGGVLLDDLVESSMPIPSPFPLKSDENSSNLPQAGSSTYTGPSHQRTSIHRHIQGVDPEHFWNSEKGRYFCNCGASFLYVTTFKYHLTMEDETINE